MTNRESFMKQNRGNNKALLIMDVYQNTVPVFKN